MIDIPFLRPNLVTYDKYKNYLERIDSNHIYSNYGPINALLEERLIREAFSRSGHCVTVVNATTGLMLAIESVKTGGRYAIMPSFTFAAAALAVQWCGLEPYFIDVDPRSWTMSNNELDAALHELGDDVAVVSPYATFGNCLDIPYYNSLVERGIPVVIDAASSLGSSVEGKQFGCSFKGLIVYSLHATKPYGIGEGGIVFSEDDDKIDKIRRMGNFGFDTSRSSIYKGLNSKLPEVMAAIGLAMLDELGARAAKRRELLTCYTSYLKDYSLLSLGWELQKINCDIAYQFFPILCPADTDNKTVCQKLKDHGVESRSYFSPGCHQQPQFSNSPRANLAVTNDLCERIVSLPTWDKMTDYEIKYIIECLSHN